MRTKFNVADLPEDFDFSRTYKDYGYLVTPFLYGYIVKTPGDSICFFGEKIQPSRFGISISFHGYYGFYSLQKELVVPFDFATIYPSEDKISAYDFHGDLAEFPWPKHDPETWSAPYVSPGDKDVIEYFRTHPYR